MKRKTAPDLIDESLVGHITRRIRSTSHGLTDIPEQRKIRFRLSNIYKPALRFSRSFPNWKKFSIAVIFCFSSIGRKQIFIS